MNFPAEFTFTDTGLVVEFTEKTCGIVKVCLNDHWKVDEFNDSWIPCTDKRWVPVVSKRIQLHNMVKDFK